MDSLGSWRRTYYSDQIGPELDGREVTIFGWVHEIRDLGGIRFLLLKDKTGKIQITIPRDKVEAHVLEKADRLQKQYCIGIRGVVKKMKKAPRGAEIIPSEIKILAVAKHPLAIDITGKTPAEIDVRLDNRILDLRRDENTAIFKIQHAILQSVREYLSNQGFLEVRTPRIIASATEGGTELFPVAYFGREAFLAQSPQLYKEQLTIDFETVFEVGTFFRAEESHTRRHISEFVSIDIEAAFSTAEDVMSVLEGLVAHVCGAVKESCSRELEMLKHDFEVPKVPFKRITYTQLLKELEEHGVHIPWGEDISTPAFRTLGKIHPGFYFITEWPTESKPFYINPIEERPEVCGAFDLMYGWIELASGGTRIHSKELLIKRMKEKGLHPESFEFHLKAFDCGMPPHAGWAIGLERLTMILTGKKNIREVVLFPRDKFRLTP